MRLPVFPAVLWLMVAAPMAGPGAAGEIDRSAWIAGVAEGGERTWRRLEGPHPDLSSRELFSTALAWCEAGKHSERLERLFDSAARMQDRDPASRSYGNFRWSWKHATIFDYNAVEFSIRGGVLVWTRHPEKLTPGARDRLRELLEFGIEGCLRHRVRESYTNIALMNAGNLILLGEAMGKPEVAREGYSRLERVLLYTAEAGIHEYGSPTYYGVDLEDLLLIEAFCRDEDGREQARALLELFWHDIACNYLPAAGKYAGANSRSYDYLSGLGNVDLHLQLAGWISGDAPRGTDAVYALLGRWQPPAALRDLSEKRFPRTVRQIWGPDPGQARTHFLTPGVSLSSAAATYGGRMDFPLTVDFAGPRKAVRCYFTSDGRGDPYGKNKIPEGRGPEAHEKALHLSPFWGAAQDRGDALGLVVYREADVPAELPLLQSHFVMPRDVDACFAGERQVSFQPGKEAIIPVAAGEPVILRKGAAAVGVRVPWCNGASVALVDDANPFGAIRLTVDHRNPGAGALRAAAFQVRIGSGLDSPAAFAAWRAAFAEAGAEAVAEAGPESIRLRAGSLVLEAAAPFMQAAKCEPAPARAVLELDGEDAGRRILGRLEPVRAQAAVLARVVPVGTAPAEWEAEDGRILAPMAAGSDPAASGGGFVAAPNGAGRSTGNVRWRLQVAQAGQYHLWARVLAPTPEDDSFFVRATAGQTVLVDRAEWPVGVHPAWAWVPFQSRQSRQSVPLELPAGEVVLELLVREDGTQLDRLFLSRDPAALPPSFRP